MFALKFDEIDIDSVAEVGGKNASLGEMYQNLSHKGINVPNGFATTSEAYWEFIYHNELKDKLQSILDELDHDEYSNLEEVGEKARNAILGGEIPEDIRESILMAYKKLEDSVDGSLQVAVRSSATAEDLPTASFAGQLETFLNIIGPEDLLKTCVKCFASLFTNRAIKYREDHGFKHMDIALSIGVQQMVRADSGCAGVAFTIDPETGFEDLIVITSSWGLGENVVQGKVNPDEYLVYKPNLTSGKFPVISSRLGSKEMKMIYPVNVDHEPGRGTVNVETSDRERKEHTLLEEEIIQLSQWCLMIEQHYDRPMDIEWAQDGFTKEIYIVQARPETVHSSKDPHIHKSFELKKKGEAVTQGTAIGEKIASGKARILSSPSESGKLEKGEVLVTDVTNPDWDPIMKKAAAIVTNRGGRTSHAAIVARELGVVAIVGCDDATEKIKDGQEVTVSCAEGKTGTVYDGLLDWEESTVDTRKINLPKTEVMFILGNPDLAFRSSFFPNNGVGLMRLEFAITNTVKVHPLALTRFNELKDEKIRSQIEDITFNHESGEQYFIDRLAEAVATMAAAFHPKDVIVRMSDFKTNEYANLLGGEQFEPEEENPMIGFRGASRYYSDEYKDGFRLECLAMKKVREDMGFTNVKLMIPFCRTVEEAKKVTATMKEHGLSRGENNLELYMMIEIPSNIVLADEFAEHFDGFSIGSNDLTQLTLGIDRDNAHIHHLFDEKNKAVKDLIARVIKTSKRTRTKIGLCGQAPSDFPEYARFLVKENIDSISFYPDALVAGIENIRAAENKMKKRPGKKVDKSKKLRGNKENKKKHEKNGG